MSLLLYGLTRGSGKSVSLPSSSKLSGPPIAPSVPLISKGAPPVSRPFIATWPRLSGAVPSPRPVSVMREASSVKAGVVVRSTKRTKPSSTASAPTRTTGGAPGVVGPWSRGGGAGRRGLRRGRARHQEPEQRHGAVGLTLEEDPRLVEGHALDGHAARPVRVQPGHVH